MTSTSNGPFSDIQQLTAAKDRANPALSLLPASKLAPTAFPLPEKATFVTIPSNSELFPVVIAYIVTNLSSETYSSLGYKALNSTKSVQGPQLHKECERGGSTGQSSCKADAATVDGANGGEELMVDLELGVGIHRFKDIESGGEYIAILQEIGEPVGTSCGANVLSNLVLCAPNSDPSCNEFALRRLVSRIWSESRAEKAGYFKVFRFNPKYKYWMSEARVKARPLDSVVMPKKTKDKLLGDINDFLSEDTQSFYSRHGIPYKRSYLLHGIPGGGKTSIIQAIAGAYGRSLAFLQPMHPEMTDDAMRAAMQRLPRNSLVVIEDIDALFAGDRAKKAKECPLTFSGLLNALDGVGSADGQLVFVTTNFREELDAALVRNGRVDVHVPFGPVTEEQCQTYFERFYGPFKRTEDKLGEMEEEKKTEDEIQNSFNENDTAARFGRAVMECLKREGREISTAVLQHFFVTHRKCNAEEALAAVEDIITEVKLREEDKKSTNPDKEAAKPDNISEGASHTNSGTLKALLDSPPGFRGRFQMAAAAGFGAVVTTFLLQISSRRGK